MDDDGRELLSDDDSGLPSDDNSWIPPSDYEGRGKSSDKEDGSICILY